MTPQEPAVGISESDSYAGSKVYAVECVCTDPDHSHVAVISTESDNVEVTIYGKMKYPIWRKSRWKGIFNLLFRGRLEVEYNIIMTKQLALNYVTAIVNAMEDLND